MNQVVIKILRGDLVS